LTALAVKVWRWSAREPEVPPDLETSWYLESPEKAAELYVASQGPKKSRVNVRDTDGQIFTFDVDLNLGIVTRVEGAGVPSI